MDTNSDGDGATHRPCLLLSLSGGHACDQSATQTIITARNLISSFFSEIENSPKNHAPEFPPRFLSGILILDFSLLNFSVPISDLLVPSSDFPSKVKTTV